MPILKYHIQITPGNFLALFLKLKLNTIAFLLIVFLVFKVIDYKSI